MKFMVYFILDSINCKIDLNDFNNFIKNKKKLWYSCNFFSVGKKKLKALLIQKHCNVYTLEDYQ